MALIVIEVLTRSSGMSAKSVDMSSMRVDRNADLADLALGDRVVGVVAHLGWQVEGYREAGRATLEQVAVAGVRFLGAGVTGVLAHGPEPAAVPGRLDRRG